MNKLYKIALTLLLSTHTILWATSTPAKSYDFTENGMCFSMHKLGDARGATDEHRGVSFDGGGIRGAMEALWAVSIEEAANNEYAELTTAEAKKAFLERTGIYKRRNITDSRVVAVGDIRFQDFFDFAAGTSTGSICAAALFHKNRFRATELLNLYLNLSVELFDLQRQPSGAGGVYTSKYSSNGLKGLLRAYFGDSKMGDAFGNKKVYFGLTNETTRSLELATNQEVDYDVHPGQIRHYVDHTLVDMISTSCAAPTFFDANEMTVRGNTTHQFCDGGLSANSPGNVSFASEKRMGRYTTEMYAFGTGGCGAYSVREKNSGKLQAGKLMSITLTANTAGSISSLKGEISDSVSPLKKLFRINAELSELQQYLDDTSPAYLGLLMEKSFACTQTKAFESMMGNLGLDHQHLPSIKDITARANALDESFVDQVLKDAKFVQDSKEDYLLRSCWRRVCALDTQWFAPVNEVSIMDKYGVLKRVNSDEFLQHLQQYAEKANQAKEVNILKTYFSAKSALQKVQPLSQEQFDASLSNGAIENAKEMLQQKAQESSVYKAISGAKGAKDSLIAAITRFWTSKRPVEEEASTPVAEDTVHQGCDQDAERTSASFDRDAAEEEKALGAEEIVQEMLTRWVNGDLSEEDKSMWYIINNYLAYLNDAGIKDTNCSDVLKIASTLYANTLFQGISNDQLQSFSDMLKKLTTYLEEQKPFFSLTKTYPDALKTFSMGWITGGTRLTSLLEAVGKRIANAPCLEDSRAEFAEGYDAPEEGEGEG